MSAAQSTHARFRRDVEQDLLRGLPAERRARLHDHLRACDACRAHHDRLHDGLRVLEGDALVSSSELDQVERWVEASWPRPTGLRARIAALRPALQWLVPAIAVAAVTAIVTLRAPLEPTPGPEHVMGLRAKGGASTAALAIDVLCGPRPDALRPARPGGCALSETLAFAYRAAAPDTRGSLTLFGVDAQGRVRYYAPTPVDPAALSVTSGAWRAAPLSVRLGVNHAPGRLRLYALLSPRAPSVENVDALAAPLTDSRGAALDGPWHLTADDTLSNALCGPDADACQSARLDLMLTQETP
jgi:hypothetical protein